MNTKTQTLGLPLIALAVALGGGIAVTGCVTPSGAWSEQGFAQTNYGWRATYPAGTSSLLGPEWQLDNWVTDPYGTMVPKDGHSYVAIDREDANRDGTIDRTERRKVFIYDLKYINRHNNGVIWAQTRRIHALDADRDLDVLLANYVDSLAGSGLYEQGSVFGLVHHKVRSFTTFVIDRKQLRLGPHSAIGAVIELAETERLRIDPKARKAKLSIVITKFQYLQRAEPGSMSSDELVEDAENSQAPGTAVMVDGQVHYKRTAVMLVGYYNDVDHFDAGLNDFAAFRARLEWPTPYPVEAPSAPPPVAAPPPVPPATPPPAASTPPPG